MKTTVFIKHPITDGNSLPQEEGKYLFIYRYDNKDKDYCRFDPCNEYDVKDALKYFAFWLEERELPDKLDIEFKAEDYASQQVKSTEMKIVYRKRKDGIYEVGETNLDITETNRTGIDEWCDCRICETWGESTAIRITKALQNETQR